MSGNRRRMARIGVMVATAAIIVSAGIAQAVPGGRGGEPCGKQGRHHPGELARKLGLSDAQKAQAKAIFQGNRDLVKPMMTSLRSEEKILQGLIHADTLDEAAIRAETAKIAGIQADLNVNRAKVEAQFRAILTPAQVEILKALPQKSHDRGDISSPPAE